MFNYYSAVNAARTVSDQAAAMRRLAGSLSALTGIVGTQYAGDDAQAYKQAVVKAKGELESAASTLDTIASHIRSAAEEVQTEETEMEAAGTAKNV